MATELASLVVRLEADSQKLQRDLARVEGKLDKTAKSSLNLQKAMAAMAGAAGFALAAKKAFDLGAAVEETGSKFRTVFGQSSKDVQAFIDDFATMAGLSQRQAQEITATTGAIAQGMGFAQDASAEFSTEIVKLAGDFASFNNIPITETANAIQSALTGEREALKRLGVVILETDVQQRALANSGKANAKALSQQEKATATLQLITERAGVAVGDLARTQDSAANRARALGAELRSSADALAAAVLPALVDVLNEGQRFEGLSIRIRENADTIAAWAKVTVAGAKAIIAPFATITRVLFNVGQQLGEVGRFMTAMVNRDFATMKDAAENMTDNWSDMGDALDGNKEAWEGLLDELDEAARTVPSVTEEIITQTQAHTAQAEAIRMSAEELREFQALMAQGIGDPNLPFQRQSEEQRRRMREGRRIGGQFDITPQAGPIGAPDFSGIERSTLEKIDAASRGIIGLADNVGLLGGTARDAARAASDMVGALASMQRGGKTVANVTSFAGAIVGMLDAAFSDENQRKIRETEKAFADAMDALEQFGQTATAQARLTATAFDALKEALRLELRETPGLRNLEADIISAFEKMQRAGVGIEEIARKLEQTFGVDAQQILDAYREHMEEIRRQRRKEMETMRQSLQVEILRAQGLDEEAAALERQIARQKRWTEALATGNPQILALTMKLFALQDAAREAAEAAEKAAEAERKLAAEMSLRDDLAVRRLEATGRDDEASILRLQMQQAKEFAEAVEQGFDKGLLADLREVQELELADALDRMREAAEEAAAQLAKLEKQTLDDLRVRELQAKGMEEEARKLRLQIQHQREIAGLQAAGVSRDIIEQLKRVQALEFEALMKELMRRADQDAGTIAKGTKRVQDAVRRQISGITDFQADRMSDQLASIAIWTRETAFNTRPIRGGDGASLPMWSAGGGAGGGITIQRLEVVVPAGTSNPQEFGRQVGRGFIETVDKRLGQGTAREDRLRGSARR